MVAEEDKINCVVKTMVLVFQTIFAIAETMVRTAKKMFFVMETVICGRESIFFKAMKMFSNSEIMVREAPTLVSIPLRWIA